MATSEVQNFFEADWITKDCIGPPDIMTVYNSSYTTPTFDAIQGQYSYPACGLDPIARPFGCCYSSLTTKSTFGFQGISINQIYDSYTEDNSPPVAANQHTYCVLESNSTFLNFTKLYILESVCYNGILCVPSNVTIFDSNICDGSYEQFDISASGYFNSTKFGELFGSIKEISDGTGIFKWTSYIPNQILVPDHKSALQVLALLGYILSIVGSLAAVYIYMIKLKRHKSIHNYLAFSSQLIWTAEHMQVMFYDYYTFPSDYSVDIYLSVFCFTNSASLLSVLISLDLMLKLLKFNKKYIYISFGLAALIHLLMVGWQYLSFLIIVNPDLYNTLTFDLGVFPTFWNLIMFVIDLGPPLLIMYFIFEEKSERKRALFALKMEALSLVVVHLVNTIIYGVLGYISTSSEFFQNDRNILALGGIETFQFMLNGIIILRFHFYMKKLISGQHSASSRSNLEDSLSFKRERSTETLRHRLSRISLDINPKRKSDLFEIPPAAEPEFKQPEFIAFNGEKSIVNMMFELGGIEPLLIDSYITPLLSSLNCEIVLIEYCAKATPRLKTRDTQKILKYIKEFKFVNGGGSENNLLDGVATAGKFLSQYKGEKHLIIVTSTNPLKSNRAKFNELIQQLVKLSVHLSLIAPIRGLDIEEYYKNAQDISLNQTDFCRLESLNWNKRPLEEPIQIPEKRVKKSPPLKEKDDDIVILSQTEKEKTASPRNPVQQVKPQTFNTKPVQNFQPNPTPTQPIATPNVMPTVNTPLINTPLMNNQPLKMMQNQMLNPSITQLNTMNQMNQNNMAFNVVNQTQIKPGNQAINPMLAMQNIPMANMLNNQPKINNMNINMPINPMQTPMQNLTQLNQQMNLGISQIAMQQQLQQMQIPGQMMNQFNQSMLGMNGVTNAQMQFLEKEKLQHLQHTERNQQILGQVGQMVPNQMSNLQMNNLQTQIGGQMPLNQNAQMLNMMQRPMMNQQMYSQPGQRSAVWQGFLSFPTQANSAALCEVSAVQIINEQKDDLMIQIWPKSMFLTNRLPFSDDVFNKLISLKKFPLVGFQPPANNQQAQQLYATIVQNMAQVCFVTRFNQMGNGIIVCQNGGKLFGLLFVKSDGSMEQLVNKLGQNPNQGRGGNVMMMGGMNPQLALQMQMQMNQNK
ncbi:hypothetical protein HDV06_000480 [Boothiomyces sp. JEL0866]|nr:hypothetical protein HDV06_000480 [Boothiomyces sp. JEL0866]